MKKKYKICVDISQCMSLDKYIQCMEDCERRDNFRKYLIEKFGPCSIEFKEDEMYSMLFLYLDIRKIDEFLQCLYKLDKEAFREEIKSIIRDYK